MTDQTFEQAELDTVINELQLMQHMALQIDVTMLRAVQANMRAADAIMPIVDPTLYRDRMTANRHNQECVAAFLAYRTRLDEIKGEMEQR